MSASMKCRLCGAEVINVTVDEMLDWDTAHRTACPGE